MPPPPPKVAPGARHDDGGVTLFHNNYWSIILFFFLSLFLCYFLLFFSNDFRSIWSRALGPGPTGPVVNLALGIPKHFDLWLTWPLTPTLINALYTCIKSPFYQIWWSQNIPEKFDPWLTPIDPCMTFDPINALHFGQWFFLPKWLL